MRNTIRNLRNFIPYLLTASLFTIAGVLLMGLLYYPIPSASTARAPQSLAITDQEYWRSHAENMLTALLANAARQLHTERQTQTRSPLYSQGNGAPVSYTHLDVYKRQPDHRAAMVTPLR